MKRKWILAALRPGLLAAFLLGIVALGAISPQTAVGSANLAPGSAPLEETANVSINSIDASIACGSDQHFTGTLKVSGNYTGSITLVVASHIPPSRGGDAKFHQTGGTT